MEFPPYPNDEDNEIVHVYNLYHLKTGVEDPVDIHASGVSSRPRVINFSTKKKMQRHIMELVLKCDKIDEDLRPALLVAQNAYEKGFLTAKDKSFELFAKVFRRIQLENSKPLGFDIYWDEEPSVLL